VKEEQQLPCQHQHRNHCGGYGQHFSQGHSGAAGLELPGDQSKNVEASKSKYGAPEDIVHFAAELEDLGADVHVQSVVSRQWKIKLHE
jgi:hypothetical protein